MASPVLWPAAGSPRIDTAGEPLKRSSFGEPSVHFAVEKAEKGTIPFCAFAQIPAVHILRQHAEWRVPLDEDFFHRPLSMKSLT
jgi:hypothetical protein